MSQHYDAGLAGGGPFTRAPMAYYPPGTDLEEAGVYFDDEGTPAGHGDLIIGDASNGAYDLEGTPGELRKYVADLGKLVGLGDAMEFARYVAGFDRNDPSALKDAMRGIIRKAREVVGPCERCGANLADDIGDGVAGHWAGCPAAAGDAEQEG